MDWIETLLNLLIAAGIIACFGLVIHIDYRKHSEQMKWDKEADYMRFWGHSESEIYDELGPRPEEKS